MNEMDDYSDDQFAMAIAAAAFAVTTLEEGSLNQKATVNGLGSSVITSKSKSEDNTIKPTDANTSFQMSNLNEAKEHGKSAVSSSAVLGDNFTKKTAESEQLQEDWTTNQKNTEKEMDAIPTIWRTIKFTDTYQNDTDGMRFESGQEQRTGPKSQSNIKPKVPLLDRKGRDRNSVEFGEVNEADAWEKEEIDKIKNRYEKRNTTIVEWENEKKTKARLQMEQKERGLGQRQSRAMQEYHDEMLWIDKITGDARALADERKRKDESKVREKARMRRSTRETRRTCFCF